MKYKFMKSDSATFRTIIYIISTIFVQGASVLFAPVYTRLLSAEAYGFSAVYLSVVNIISIICGLQTYGTLIVKKSELDYEEYKEYCSNILELSFAGCIVCLMFIIPFSGLLKRMLAIDGWYLFVLVLHSFGVYCVNYLYAYLTAERNVISYLIVSILMTLGSFCISVYFISVVDFEHRYLAMYIGNALPYVVAGVAICLFFLRPGRYRHRWQNWEDCLEFSVPLVFHNLATLLLAQADRIMIKQMIGAGEAGIYSMCYSMALPTSALWAAMNNAWKTEYFVRLSEGDVQYVNIHSKRYLYIYTLATMGFLMIFPEFTKIMTSDQYWGGIVFIPVIIVNCYFVFLYSFPANYEFAKKKTKGLSVITVTGAMANIGLNYLLIPQYGMIGAAIATLVVQVFIFIAHDILARKWIGGYHYEWKFYIRGIVPVIVTMIIAYGIMDYVFIRWICAVIIAIIALSRIIKYKAIF